MGRETPLSDSKSIFHMYTAQTEPIEPETVIDIARNPSWRLCQTCVDTPFNNLINVHGKPLVGHKTSDYSSNAFCFFEETIMLGDTDINLLPQNIGHTNIKWWMNHFLECTLDIHVS